MCPDVKGKDMGKMKRPEAELHALLKEHWNDRRLFWAGTFDPRKPLVIGIDTFGGLMALLRSAIEGGEWELADSAISHVPLYSTFLASPRYAGHAPHLTNLTNAIARRAGSKALLHLRRLTGTVRRVAADRVFKDGERVSVIRTEHGWYDGSVSGTVKPGSGGHVVQGDDGMEYEIQHLRDIR